MVMKTDEVNPMNELERLFDERKLCLARKADYEETIKKQKIQINKTEENLGLVTARISEVENSIKEYTKKL